MSKRSRELRRARHARSVRLENRGGSICSARAKRYWLGGWQRYAEPLGRRYFELLEDRRVLNDQYLTAPIQAWAYVDMNGTGIPATGDPRIPGVTIQLTDTAGTNFTAQTDANGQAWFGPGWPIATATLTATPPQGYLPGAAYHLATPAQFAQGPLVGANSLSFVNAFYRNDDIEQPEYGDLAFAGPEEGFYFGYRPGSDIAPTGLTLTPDEASAQFGYTIAGLNTAVATTVDLYWASGKTFADHLGTAIASETVAQNTSAGSYGPFTAAIDWDNEPPNARYLLVVANPNNTLPETNPNNNVGFLQLNSDIVPTAFKRSADGSGVDLSYNVVGADLPAGTSVAVYWASGTTVQSEISQQFIQVAETSEGSYSLHDNVNFASAPAGANHLLFVTDPDDLLQLSNTTNHVKSLSLIDIAVTSFTWDANGNGVDFAYAVNGAPVTTATTIGVYWASDDSPHSIMQPPIFSQALDGTLGAHGPINVPASDFATPPTGAKYVIVDADPTNLVDDYNPDNNWDSLGVPDLVALANPSGVNAVKTSNNQATFYWNSLASGGGFTFTYRIDDPSDDTLPDTTIDFNWQTPLGPQTLAYRFALDANAKDAQGQPAYAIGTHQIVITQLMLNQQVQNDPSLHTSSSPPDPSPGNIATTFGADTLVASIDPQGNVVETDKSNNTSSITVLPLAVDIVSPGFNPGEPQQTFLQPFVKLATDLQNSIVNPGSTLSNRVASYVSQWQSATPFLQGFVEMLLSLVATADSELTLDPVQSALYAKAATILSQWAAETAQPSDQNLKTAANSIVQSLTGPGGELLPPAQSNQFQVINLFGQSRGAELNAYIAHLLTNRGYKNIADFVSLDGYAQDWSNVTPGAGVLTKMSITQLLKGVPVNNLAFNFTAMKGLAFDQTVLTDLQNPAFISSILQLSAPLTVPITAAAIAQVQKDTVAGLVAPARAASGFIDVPVPGTTKNPGSTHTDITGAFDEQLAALYGGLIVKGYLYQHSADGTQSPSAAQPLSAMNLSSSAAQPALPATASVSAGSLSAATPIDDTSGFIDGSIEALWELNQQNQTVNSLTTGDPTLDPILQALATQANAISVFWQTTGHVTVNFNLATDNPQLQLDGTVGNSASVGQTIVLPNQAQSVNFDLGVQNAVAGDTLEVLMNGNVLQSFDLTTAGGGFESVPLPAGTGQTATFTFQLSTAASSTVTVTLAEIAIGTPSTQAPTVLGETIALPSISHTITDAANTGVLVSSFQGDLATPNAADAQGLGIAVVGSDSTDGTLQYSIDGGTTWQDVGPVSDSTALVLTSDPETRLRYVPSATFAGSIASVVSFRAWDPVNTGLDALDGQYVDLANPLSQTPPSGLVGWWQADNNANDSSGLGNNGALGGETGVYNNGTLSSAATFAPGKIGEAFEFDGRTGSMVVPNSPSLNPTTQFTLNAWIDPSTLMAGNEGGILSKLNGTGQGYSFAVTDSNTALSVEFNAPGEPWATDSLQVTLPSPIPVGQWTSVAATYDGEYLTLYENGQAVGSTFIGPKTVASSTANLYISGSDYGTFSIFNGEIDQPQIYDRALSASEIAQLYDEGADSLSGTNGFSSGVDAASIDVTDVPPTALNDTVTVSSASPVAINVLAEDTDPDGTINPASVTIVANPQHGSVSVDPVTGLVTYTPSNTPPVADAFSYTVSDTLGVVSNPAVVTILPLHGPALAPIANQTSAAGDTITFQASATDLDSGAILTYSLAAGAPAGATIGPSTGVFSWTPTAAQSPGDYNITLDVADNGQPPLTASTTFQVQLAPHVIVADATVFTTGNGTVQMDFVVTVSSPFAQPITMNFASADGLALAGQDYDAVSGSLAFTPGGPLTQTIVVLVKDESQNQPDKTFYLNLSNVNGAVVDKAQAEGVIQYQRKLLSIADVTQAVGPGASTFQFTVNLSAPSVLPVSVDYATADGSATVAAGDYQATVGTLTFPAGQTTEVIPVPVAETTHQPGDRVFFVNLSNPVNATIPTTFGEAVGTILGPPGSGNTYYINGPSIVGDIYCTAPGNNANSGTSPSTPMASLNALTTKYQLQAGDTVYIDTGTYNLVRNVVLSLANSGVRIVGAGERQVAPSLNPSTILADNPVGFWPLGDSASGTAVDATGHGLNGCNRRSA
jgi:hypothetical protein